MIQSLRFIRYTRKSTDREDRQVKSLGDQGQVLTELERRYGLHVVAEFEESKSAKRPGLRPLFTEMLAMIARGEADAILCWHVNRLVRNRKEGGELEWMLQEGVIQCIKTPERDYFPQDNALLLAVETAVATQYSKDLGSDIRRAARQKAERGWWPYRPKLGYRIDPETHDVVTDPDSFSLLRRGWDLMLTGCYTVPEVREHLTDIGLRVKAMRRGDQKEGPREMKPISRSSLYRLFTDPFYAGFFDYEGVLQPGNHEPMVSAHEFERVREILGRADQPQPQRKEFPFTGLMRCANCGCLITAEEKVKRYKTSGTSRVYTYYHCSRSKGCRQVSVSDSFVEEAIRTYVEPCSLHEDAAKWAVEEVEKIKGQISHSNLAKQSRPQGELTGLRSRLDALFEMREQREITAEEFASRKSRLAGIINGLTVSIRAQEQHQIAAAEEIQAKLQLSPQLVYMLNGSPRDKRRAASAIASSYVLTLDTTEQNLKVDLDPLFDVIRTFTLKSPPTQQVGTGGSSVDNPIWRAFMTSIRNLIDQEGRAHVL